MGDAGPSKPCSESKSLTIAAPKDDQAILLWGHLSVFIDLHCCQTRYWGNQPWTDVILLFFPLYPSELSSDQYFLFLKRRGFFLFCFFIKGVFPSCHNQKVDQARSAVNNDFINAPSPYNSLQILQKQTNSFLLFEQTRNFILQKCKNLYLYVVDLNVFIHHFRSCQDTPAPV